MANGGLVGAIRVDVVRLHETWMELVFPRQRSAAHSVLGKWQPRNRADRIKYRIWGAMGAPVVAVLYPLLLIGFAARFNARRLDSARARFGGIGIVLLVALLWGLFTAATRLRLAFGGSVAVAAASAVAVVSAGLAAAFSRIGGRLTTVVFAYPMAMNALFLPPVVAALYDPSLGVVFERSTAIAIFLLDEVLVLVGLDEYLRANFTLEGMGYVLMWIGIATPLGWFLGFVVTLADLVRPQSDE